MKLSKMPTPNRRRRQWLAAAMIGLTLTACGRKPDSETKTPPPDAPVKFNAVDITGADYAHKLSLPDFDGHERSLTDFKGKVVYVFFGFTQCPDVCPTTMAELAEVRRKLGADGKRVQGVFVTIDPERDTPSVLKAYLQAMDPSFIGLRGSLAQTEAVAREFKVFYQKVQTQSGYTMDHTAGAFVFDPDGQVRLFARYGIGVDALTADIRQLLKSSGASPR
jgi:protein SCO1/2